MNVLAKLSTLLLVVPLAAQSFTVLGAPSVGAPLTTGYWMSWNDVPWTGFAIPAGTVTRTVAASLSGHVAPDVVVLKGSSAVLLAAPGIHQHAAPLPGTGGLGIKDLGVLRGGGGNQGRDALLLATSAGLYTMTMDNAANGTATLLPNSAQWGTALRLAVRKQSTSWTAFGADRNGNIFVYEQGTFGGSPTPTTISTSFLVDNRGAIDMECIDWDGAGDLELAVLTSASLRIYSYAAGSQSMVLTETLATFSPELTDVNDIAAITAYNGVPGQTLAWLNESASHLFLYRYVSNPTPPNPHYSTTTVALPSPHNYSAITACKAVAYEPHDSLFLTRKYNDGVTLLAQRNDFSFVHSGSFGFQLAMSATGSSANTVCAPAIVDVDADGDCDLVTVMPATAGSSVQHRVLQPWFFHRATPWQEITIPSTPPIDTIEFDVPGRVNASTEITMWATEGGLLVPTPHESPAPIPYSTNNHLTWPLDPTTFVNPQTSAHYDGLWIMVRPVIEVGGVVVAAGEPSLFEGTVTWIPLGSGGGGPWQIIISRVTPRGKFPPPPPGYTPKPKK